MELVPPSHSKLMSEFMLPVAIGYQMRPRPRIKPDCPVRGGVRIRLIAATLETNLSHVACCLRNARRQSRNRHNAKTVIMRLIVDLP